MANTIHLISKQYINTDILLIALKKAAQKVNFQFRQFDNDYPININIFNEINELLDIYIRDSMGYNRSFNNLYGGIQNYGILVEIDYHKDEKPIVLFLREILKEMPELLVYDEETPKGIDCYVYNKQFFDNHQGTDYYAIMDKNPPKSLNDLA